MKGEIMKIKTVTCAGALLAALLLTPLSAMAGFEPPCAPTGPGAFSQGMNVNAGASLALPQPKQSMDSKIPAAQFGQTGKVKPSELDSKQIIMQKRNLEYDYSTGQFKTE